MLAITQKAKDAILKNGGEVVEERNFVKIPANAESVDNVNHGGYGNLRMAHRLCIPPTRDIHWDAKRKYSC